MRTTTPLRDIDPDAIRPNPENPRLIFREQEMTELLESISNVGIQVPITVYEDRGAYFILDGERRWRCARKLNLAVVPAIVQPKPSQLENILMMFNIHNVRVDWDLMPMARKLGTVRGMLEDTGRDAAPKALSGITGVPLPTVRRALDLLGLPQEYQDALLAEAEKPKEQQRFTADLFVEVYKSLHAVERNAPEVFEAVGREEYVTSMVEKYLSGVVRNVVDYRQVSKIARAENAGVDQQTAKPIIVRLVRDKRYGVTDAYKASVEAAYEQRDAVSRARRLAESLRHTTGDQVSVELREALLELRREITRLLR